jgi:AraC family transcriptional regulator
VSKSEKSVSSMPYLKAGTKKPSDIGIQIHTISSSKSLNWHGVAVEHGTSDRFVADNVEMPTHYFAMLLKHDFSYERKEGRHFQKRTMHAGEIWLNPAHTPFSHRVTTPNEFILLSVAPERLAGHFNLSKDRTINLRRDHHLRDPELHAYISTFLDMTVKSKYVSTLFFDGILSSFLKYFVDKYSDLASQLTRGYSCLDLKRIKNAMNYIEDNYMMDLSVEELSHEIGTSKYHFIRSFRNATGLTPYRYLLKVRLERAKRILKSNRYSIAEVSDMLGFTDQSHFTRQFKREVGVTPKNYICR